ncbi:hypothetical protein Lesp02_35930 [Lentzea sp. NBRC 105346]|uniref:hypothetical protein n=1 Tax=Lentzea sp. NBRC 105346 TaxID=3032205 RepID=UPI0024A2ADE8|nr:hypothetical protein [Lentzea sp. NBRC 105346]GLZ31405.1 hypothetical protein Lesp02_35930 [Lentzea sp. NBRC 105346]
MWNAAAGVALAVTLAMSGVANAAAGDYYGPYETEEECNEARVLFDYADPCGYYISAPRGWWFYGGFN